MRSEWISILGLSAAATEARAAAVAADNQAVAGVYATILAGIDGFESPDLTWRGTEISAAAERWRAAVQ